MNASSKKVTVLTPNGRRQNVPVTPSTTLLHILEEVCKKFTEFPSEEYGLKHYNKSMDVTQMIRFSGLPNNCVLEMFQLDKKRVSQKVDLCVQLESGDRFQDSFVPDITLIDVLKKVCPEEFAKVEHPVVVYMRTEVFGEELKTKTLKDLGMTSGRSLIRLIDKRPEDLKVQANVYIPPKEVPKPESTSSEDAKQKKANKTGNSGGFALTSEMIKAMKPSTNESDEIPIEEVPRHSPELTERKHITIAYDWGSGTGQSISGKVEEKKEVVSEEEELNEEELENDPHIVKLGDRNAILFSLDSSQTIIEDLPDSFFDLSVHDLKLVLRDLNRIRSGTSGDPLLTARMREMEQEKNLSEKLHQYTNTIIRIQFPDRLVLQGKFKSTDTIADIYEFVRKFIKDDLIKFHLFTIPPKTIPSLDLTLVEANFVPKTVMHFGVDEDTKNKEILTYLREEFLEKLSTFDGARKAANINKKATAGSTKMADGSIDQARPGPSTGAIPKRPRNVEFRQSTAESTEQVPKWFQPFKK